MNDIEEVRLKKFRSVYTISIFFLTFFGGRFYITNEFFHFVRLKQQKCKIRIEHFDEWDYQTYYVWKYKWKTIKID